MLYFCIVLQVSTKEKEAELRAMQEKYGVDGAIPPISATSLPALPFCLLV